MFIRAAISGVLVTILLVTVIAGARLIGVDESQELVVMNDVEVMDITPPPPPPDLTEPEPEEPEPDPMQMPASAPSLDVPVDVPAFDMPTVAPSLNKMSLTTPMHSFHVDSGPAQLPVEKPVVRVKSSSKKTTKPKITSAKPKSVYSTGELDRLPRARRVGRLVWPRGVSAKSATVRLLIEIDTSGKVRVVRVVSSTNASVNDAAKKVATGSLYTVPTYRGKAVKTQFYKTYNLKKTR